MAKAKNLKPVEQENRQGKLIYLYPEQIQIVEGFNTRYDMGDVEGLARSILSAGIKSPLVGYKTGELLEDGWPVYALTDGHRRYAAALMVADKVEEGQFIPFIVEPESYTDVDRIIDMLITGENNKGLNLLETARGVKRLTDTGLTRADIARKIGKTSAHVGDCITLMEHASKKQIKQVEAGQITPTALLEILKAAIADKADMELVEESIDSAIEKQEKSGKRKPISATQVEEEHGAPLTQKGKLKASKAAGETTRTEKTEPGKFVPDASYLKLIAAREALKAQSDRIPFKEAFAQLNYIIKFLDGRKTLLEGLDHFFVAEEENGFEEDLVEGEFIPEEEAEEVEEEAPAPVKKGKKAAKEEAPAAKPTKGMPTIKEAKKAKAKPEPVEEEVEEDEDVDFDEDEVDETLE